MGFQQFRNFSRKSPVIKVKRKRKNCNRIVFGIHSKDREREEGVEVTCENTEAVGRILRFGQSVALLEVVQRLQEERAGVGLGVRL